MPIGDALWSVSLFSTLIAVGHVQQLVQPIQVIPVTTGDQQTVDRLTDEQGTDNRFLLEIWPFRSTATLTHSPREWRNWQTRHRLRPSGRNTVQVQVLFPALSVRFFRWMTQPPAELDPKESPSRDSELTPEAVTPDTAQVEESPQQTTPDGDRPRRRIAIGTQRANSEQTDTAPLHVHYVRKFFQF